MSEREEEDPPSPSAAAEDPSASGIWQVPLDAFFRLQLALPRLQPLPPLDGSLQGWPRAALLPDLSSLHGQGSFGRVLAGWTLDGLAFGVEVDVGHDLRLDPEHPFRSDGIEVWVDTRDSREARKPTRFCHHFLLLPGGHGPRGRACYVQEMNPGGVKRPEDMADIQRIRAKAEVGRGGYTLEFLLPREVLAGYAPLEATSVALAYRLRSSVYGVQDLAFGEHFPLWRNPSLWLSARLAAG